MDFSSEKLVKFEACHIVMSFLGYVCLLLWLRELSNHLTDVRQQKYEVILNKLIPPRVKLSTIKLTNLSIFYFVLKEKDLVIIFLQITLCNYRLKIMIVMILVKVIKKLIYRSKCPPRQLLLSLINHPNRDHA